MTKGFDRTKEAIAAAVKAQTEALTAAAILVHGNAVTLAPVDTGNLRSSLAFEVEEDTARVGTNVEYATKVEYGHRQRPQPYLRPALDNNKAKISKLMGDIIKKAVEGAGK